MSPSRDQNNILANAMVIYDAPQPRFQS